MVYSGAHSLLIGERHTWRDWHLVPSSPPMIVPAKPRTRYIDIPGRNGRLDASEFLGGITYDDREGTWQFIIDPETDIDGGYIYHFETIYSDIMQYIQGKRLNVVLVDDPAYYYNGRLYVDSISSEDSNRTITIHYTLDPFKRLVTKNVSEWLWNELNLISGTIPRTGSQIQGEWL